MRVYYVATQAKFDALMGMAWEGVDIGPALRFGWVDWQDNPNARAAFEAQAGVLTVGPALAPGTLPAALTTALAVHGVTLTDSRWDVVKKMTVKFGGVTIQE